MLKKAAKTLKRNKNLEKKPSFVPPVNYAYDWDILLYNLTCAPLAYVCCTKDCGPE